MLESRQVCCPDQERRKLESKSYSYLLLDQMISWGFTQGTIRSLMSMYRFVFSPFLWKEHQLSIPHLSNGAVTLPLLLREQTNIFLLSQIYLPYYHSSSHLSPYFVRDLSPLTTIILWLVVLKPKGRYAYEMECRWQQIDDVVLNT